MVLSLVASSSHKNTQYLFLDFVDLRPFDDIEAHPFSCLDRVINLSSIDE